ncbi:MAG: hypothetical protein E7052_06875 [Lentisphaerae bacterium]|nr:hypothetical protein [Lentisphaerota bacterium]
MKQRRNSTARLKGILFVHQTISRKDLIKLSKLNPRTVSRCMDTLMQQGLIEVSRKIISRGQPQIHYTLRTGEASFYFLILSVLDSQLYVLLCDNLGFPISMQRQEIKSREKKKVLPNLLFSAVRKVTDSLNDQGKKIYSIAVNLADGNIYSAQFKNKLINMLLPYCSHDAICGYCDEFLLSQYAINNYLPGRVLGLVHKNNTWQHVVINGYLNDPATVLKVNKRLDTVTDFSRDHSLLQILDFEEFVKHLYEKYYLSLKKINTFCYSEVYIRALNGDPQAWDILEDYAVLLGKSIIFLNRKMHFDNIVLMHSRPIIIEKVRQVLAQAAAPGEDIPFITANFSSNELLYVPSGYLRRELFSFEHGKFLPDLQNKNNQL